MNPDHEIRLMKTPRSRSWAWRWRSAPPCTLYSGMAATILQPARLPCDAARQPRRRQTFTGPRHRRARQAGKPITLVDLPKLIVHRLLQCTSMGMQDAAKRFATSK